MAELSKIEQIGNRTPDDSGAKQILIADDEPLIRGLLQDFLRIWGYRTLVASDGKEALEVAAEHPGDIDLLLSDVTMPKINGHQLAGTLTMKHPSLKVILMSGFSHAHVGVQEGWRFVQKPFKATDIKETIKDVLSASSK